MPKPQVSPSSQKNNTTSHSSYVKTDCFVLNDPTFLLPTFMQNKPPLCFWPTLEGSNEFEDFRCHRCVKVSHSVKMCHICFIFQLAYFLHYFLHYLHFLCCSVTLCHIVLHSWVSHLRRMSNLFQISM
jgi:hypothetical protein